MKVQASGPSSAPTVLDDAGPASPAAASREHNSSLEGAEYEEKVEPRSTPILRASTCPNSRCLDQLSEEQLTKLTRSNTRKNLGGRKSRFRIQMERVFRRLDNLASDAWQQQRHQMQALPLVSPDRSPVPDRANAVDALVVNHEKEPNSVASSSSSAASPTSKVSTYAFREGEKDRAESNGTELTGLEHAPEDCFAIEPATTAGSLFQAGSTSEPGTMSATSLGVPKSVRISTSVTILDYVREDEPVSVSTLERLEHPTRRDRSAMNRKLLAQEIAFDKANIGGSALIPAIDESVCENAKTADQAGKEVSSEIPSTASTPKKSPSSGTSRKCEDRKATPVARIPPRAPFAKPSPGGPYGPRSLPK